MLQSSSVKFLTSRRARSRVKLANSIGLRSSNEVIAVPIYFKKETTALRGTRSAKNPSRSSASRGSAFRIISVVDPHQAIVLVLLLAIQVVDELHGFNDIVLLPTFRCIRVGSHSNPVLGTTVQHLWGQVDQARSLDRGLVDSMDKVLIKGIGTVPVKILKLIV